MYGPSAELAGLRVFDPGGELVISGSVDEVLAELVGLPAEDRAALGGGPEAMPGRGA